MDLPYEKAVDDVAFVLAGHGYEPAGARVLAENCVTAQRDGSVSHGLFRVRDYVSAIRSGYVNGSPSPRLEDAAPGFLRVDADNGFAQLALAKARARLVEKATANGVAVLAIRNSHHLGALYLDIEDFAADGFIALAVVNSSLYVAPPGATRAVFGTNPLAFAAPRASGPPLVFDQASASVAHGDLQVAAREGRQLPPTTGIDSRGEPTGEPQAILDGGALSPFGGHKGASIALMVEILCAGLVGADFAFEAPIRRPDGVPTVRTGETIVLIDPRAGAGGSAALPRRVDDLVAALVEAGQDRIPGERHARARSLAGSVVSVEETEWAAVERLSHGHPHHEVREDEGYK